MLLLLLQRTMALLVLQFYDRMYSSLVHWSEPNREEDKYTWISVQCSVSSFYSRISVTSQVAFFSEQWHNFFVSLNLLWYSKKRISFLFSTCHKEQSKNKGEITMAFVFLNYRLRFVWSEPGLGKQINPHFLCGGPINFTALLSETYKLIKLHGSCATVLETTTALLPIFGRRLKILSLIFIISCNRMAKSDCVTAVSVGFTLLFDKVMEALGNLLYERQA